MGVALTRPSGSSNIAEKILKIFIYHKLPDGENFLLKYPPLIFAKKWVWSCHAPQSGQNFWEYFSIFLNNKLHFTKGIFISN